MLTKSDLAEMLQGVNVIEVAKAANVSTKTIYRLRNQQHAPTLDTVERLLAAIKAIGGASCDEKPALCLIAGCLRAAAAPTSRPSRAPFHTPTDRGPP